MQQLKGKGSRQRIPIDEAVAETKERMQKDPTIRQKRFIDKLLLTGKVKDSALEAGYSEETAEHALVKVRQSTVAQNYIKRIKSLYDTSSIDKQFILNGILELAENSEKHEIKLRAYELLGKTLSLFSDKLQVEQVSVTLSPEEVKEKLKKIKDALE